MDLEVRLAYESGHLRGPARNVFQRWALTYYIVTMHREERELADRNIRQLTLSIAPQRFAEMYLEDGATDGLLPDEEHITADELGEFDRWFQSLQEKREIGANEVPKDDWGPWQ
ncbi:conserved hypothetical protein [Rhodococcus phage E3]|uniref:tail assembly chaperone n=1 Tax=Rhodococcus phage E3 TaxID=1007869 RepID=UPI0002C6A35D|nr:tail assembly chaperone [Rhodococcus phage E3]AEQ21130.1 conserved hypothetical protein [Rhodococcus phage E3]